MRMYSASHAIHQAYCIELMSKGVVDAMTIECSSAKKDKNWHHCDAVESGIIQAALSRLPVHLQAWAVWCHGPRLPEFLPEQGHFFEWLNDDVAIRLLSSERNYRAATCDKIRDIVAYTVMDYRHYTATGQHLYPVKEIRKRCGILRQNWQDLADWHEYYWLLCDKTLDRAVLPVVAEAMETIQ